MPIISVRFLHGIFPVSSHRNQKEKTVKKDNGYYKDNKAILDGITVGDIAEYLNRRPAEFMCSVCEYGIPADGKTVEIVSVSKNMKFHVFNIHKVDYLKLPFSIGVETEKNSGNYGVIETEKHYEIGKDVTFKNDRGLYLRFCLHRMTKDEIIEGVIRSSNIKVFVHLCMPGWSMLGRTEKCEEIFVLEHQMEERRRKLADIGRKVEKLCNEADNEIDEMDKTRRRLEELRATN